MTCVTGDGMIGFAVAQRGSARCRVWMFGRYWSADMHVRHATTNPMPVLLLDADMGRANKLATQLASKDFTTRIENTGASAQSAIKEGYFATLIVIADLEDKACLAWLEDLRRTASRSWMIVVSPRCDTTT